MVTGATTVARMMFAAPVSWGYTSADDQVITSYPLESCRW